VVQEIRAAGARIRFIPDGDVSAALLAVTERTPVDVLWGIGGTPEGVLAAAGIKCIGGQILGRLWPRDDEERRAALDAGYDLDEVLDADRLVAGDDVFFATTGVTDGDVLEGVRYEGASGASTESLVMRSRSGTVRRVHARHDRAKLREIARAERYGWLLPAAGGRPRQCARHLLTPLARQGTLRRRASPARRAGAARPRTPPRPGRPACSRSGSPRATGRGRGWPASAGTRWSRGRGS
jgi:hypothetical protein